MNFLYPVRELEAWMTASGTTDGSPVESGGSTTVTATEDVFYPSMVGKSIDFTTSENSYTITAYTSSTVVVVSGDASGETDAAFTITADGYYRLPDNFAGLRDGFTFDPSSTECYYDIKMASEHKVRSELMREETGRPYICAVRPVEFDPTLGQRFDVMLHPIPDADYTLNYRAIVVPERLDSVNKYRWAGLCIPVRSSSRCWPWPRSLKKRTALRPPQQIHADARRQHSPGRRDVCSGIAGAKHRPRADSRTSVAQRFSRTWRICHVRQHPVLGGGL